MNATPESHETAADTLKSVEQPVRKSVLHTLWRSYQVSLELGEENFRDLRGAIVESMEASGVHKAHLATLLDAEVRHGQDMKSLRVDEDERGEYQMIHDALRAWISRHVR